MEGPAALLGEGVDCGDTGEFGVLSCVLLLDDRFLGLEGLKGTTLFLDLKERDINWVKGETEHRVNHMPTIIDTHTIMGGGGWVTYALLAARNAAEVI